MRHLVVMGVSGSGKSTVGAILARRIGVRFVDADDLHPAANVRKMRAGHPLTEADRAPWLRAVAACLAEAEGPIVLACSALRRAHRDVIRAAAGQGQGAGWGAGLEAGVVFVHLDGPPALLRARLTARRGHFAPAGLLDSQLATLERPAPDEGVIRAGIGAPPDRIADDVLRALGAPPA